MQDQRASRLPRHATGTHTGRRSTDSRTVARPWDDGARLAERGEPFTPRPRVRRRQPAEASRGDAQACTELAHHPRTFRATETSYPTTGTASVGGRSRVTAVPWRPRRDAAEESRRGAGRPGGRPVGKPLHFSAEDYASDRTAPDRLPQSRVHRPVRPPRTSNRATGHRAGHRHAPRAATHCAGLGAGWGAVHATPPVLRRRRQRRVADRRCFAGSGRRRAARGDRGRRWGRQPATLRYERPYACPAVTGRILAELEGGKIVFDVYLQQGGGARPGGRSGFGVLRPPRRSVGGGGWRGRSSRRRW